jgi:transglutaminase-like putative cysteine protease
MDAYLKRTDIIDHDAPAIRELAQSLRSDDAQLTAERCFLWVRDFIRHSSDHGDSVVTVTASDVLKHGTGLCYAKSHLLTALLRANDIPCGFVYQRLAVDEAGSTFCLHGLNAVWLPGHGWYRLDARGNRGAISARFEPPIEYLAFETKLPGERLFEEIYSEPLPVVVQTLQRHTQLSELCLNLPDVEL